MRSDEQAIREFLAPLRTITPVDIPEASTRPARHRAEHAFVAGAIVLALATLLFAYLVHHEPSQPRPATHDAFARMRGWIGIGPGAFDPNAPDRPPVLWHSLARQGEVLDWSRDGTHVLLNNGHEIYVMSATGGVRVLNDRPGIGAFTPDSQHVIYQAGGDIREAAVGGGPSRVLARMHPGNGTENLLDGIMEGGEVSPDGSAIVFDHFVRHAGGLWLMNQDGGDRRPITINHARVVALNGGHEPAGVGALAWYPDSKRLLAIAYGQHSTDPCVVFSVNVDNGDLRRFGPTGFCPARADVSPTQQQFIFSGIGPGLQGLLRITDLSGHTIRTIRVPPGFGSSGPPVVAPTR